MARVSVKVRVRVTSRFSFRVRGTVRLNFGLVLELGLWLGSSLGQG